MLDVLNKANATTRSRPAQEAPTEAPDQRWSVRRTLVFVILGSSFLWAVILLGIYGLLNLLTPH